MLHLGMPVIWGNRRFRRENFARARRGANLHACGNSRTGYVLAVCFAVEYAAIQKFKTMKELREWSRNKFPTVSVRRDAA